MEFNNYERYISPENQKLMGGRVYEQRQRGLRVFWTITDDPKYRSEGMDNWEVIPIVEKMLVYPKYDQEAKILFKTLSGEKLPNHGSLYWVFESVRDAQLCVDLFIEKEALETKAEMLNAAAMAICKKYNERNSSFQSEERHRLPESSFRSNKPSDHATYARRQAWEKIKDTVGEQLTPIKTEQEAN